jgi:hypothetical protein
MNTRPVKTDLQQVVRLFMRAFTLQNFGAQPSYIYLPTDLYDHFTDIIEDNFRKAGVPEHALDQCFRYFYHGVEVLQSRTGDIIVTDELLP